MATTDFHAHALFDFNAEDPNELGFVAGEVLLITSTTAGEGWWFAQNSAGQAGAIPANYVQAINDEVQQTGYEDQSTVDNNNLQPEQQQPQQTTYQYHTDLDDHYLQPEPQQQTAYQDQTELDKNNFPTEQQQYPVTNNWSLPEQSSWQTEQTNQSNESNLTPSSSFDSILSPTMNENTLSSIPNTPDPYVTVRDPSPPPNTVPMTLSNPVARKNTTTDQSEWYSEVPHVPAPVLASYPPMQNNPLSPFGYPQTTPIQQQQQQQNASSNSMYTQPVTQFDSIYDTPSTFVYPSPTVETTNTQSTPVIQSPSPPPADLISLDSPKPLTSSKSNADNTATSKPSKPKSDKGGWFTLRRKTKSEPDKRRLSMENHSEPPSPAVKHESDSDFDNSLPSTHEQESEKQAAGGTDTKAAVGTETKAAPRARFFDKHGIDNYLLHGSKVKFDEHVEIDYDENKSGVCWSYNQNTPPFTCKVEEPTKGTKIGGLKTFMEYKIHTQVRGTQIVVSRRYKHFDWLHEQLANKYRFICVPALPGKQIAGRFEQEFVEGRRRQLELWLNRICQHPVLCASFPVQHFVTCELTEKNNKEWKAGKRKSEKDEMREASWLQCVTFTNSNLTETEIEKQIGSFAQQQPGLETHLKNLSQGFAKYLERHTEIYKSDIQRIGDLFTNLHTVVQVDTTTPGNQELSNSISKISSSYKGIAELYKTKASEGIRDFNERIQEYIGLLASFPLILSIHKSSTEFMRTVQQRGPAAIPDYNTVINRSQVLNHVVLAEINFFQKEKVTDLSTYMKTLLNEQMQFYDKITAEIRDAASTFN